MFGLSQKEKDIRQQRAHSYKLLNELPNLQLGVGNYSCFRCGETLYNLHRVVPYTNVAPSGETFSKYRYTFLGHLCARCQEVSQSPHSQKYETDKLMPVSQWVAAQLLAQNNG